MILKEKEKNFFHIIQKRNLKGELTVCRAGKKKLCKEHNDKNLQ